MANKLDARPATEIFGGWHGNKPVFISIHFILDTKKVEILLLAGKELKGLKTIPKVILFDLKFYAFCLNKMKTSL